MNKNIVIGAMHKSEPIKITKENINIIIGCKSNYKFKYKKRKWKRV